MATITVMKKKDKIIFSVKPVKIRKNSCKPGQAHKPKKGKGSYTRDNFDESE